MTRKRFIKLLMSKGVSRNKAQAIARIVRIIANRPELIAVYIGTKSGPVKLWERSDTP